MVDPPPKATRPRIPPAAHAGPHGKISDSTLNLVLSFSNDVRLETAGNQFNGRPFELVQGSKVFYYISLCGCLR